MRISALNFIRKSWSESFNNGIVYNRVGFKCICTFFSASTLSSFTNFLPKQLNLDGQWEVATSEISYPSIHQNVIGGKFMFFDKKLSKSSECHYLEPGLYPFHYVFCWSHEHSHLRKTQSQRKLYHRWSVSRNAKSWDLPGKCRIGSSILSTDLEHFFGGNIGNEFGVMLRGKGPHKTKSASDIVRIHCLMMYTDLIEYNIVGDTKAPLLRCFLFFRSLSLETLWLLDSTRTIRPLATCKSDRCSKFPFIVFTLTWETPAVKKYPLYLSVSLILCWCSEKPPIFIFNPKGVTRWLLQDK